MKAYNYSKFAEKLKFILSLSNENFFHQIEPELKYKFNYAPNKNFIKNFHKILNENLK